LETVEKLERKFPAMRVHGAITSEHFSPPFKNVFCCHYFCHTFTTYCIKYQINV